MSLTQSKDYTRFAFNSHLRQFSSLFLDMSWGISYNLHPAHKAMNTKNSLSN